jgi:hypothetical protein
MTCYQKHLLPIFESLGLEYDKKNRARVDVAIRELLSVPAGAHCPEVWDAIKALPPDERVALGDRVGDLL